MFRKEEREKSESKGNCSNCPHPHYHPFPISTHIQHNVWPPKWWQQEKTEKWRSQHTRITCLQRDLIHHSFIPPCFAGEGNYVSHDKLGTGARAFSVHSAFSSLQHTGSRQGLGGADSPEPWLTSLLPDLSQAHIHPSPLFSTGPHSTACAPCFPHLQVLGGHGQPHMSSAATDYQRTGKLWTGPGCHSWLDTEAHCTV